MESFICNPDLEVALKRKDKNTYYLFTARQIALGSKCPDGKQHGSIAVRHHRMVSTGYNGPPAGHHHCEKGCVLELQKQAGKKKDLEACPAVHSEMNCIVTAAMIGTPLVGSVFYVTKRPCDNCLKHLRNLNVAGVVYLGDDEYSHYVMIGPQLTVEFKLTYGE